MVQYQKKFTPEESSVIREAEYHPERSVLEIRIEQKEGQERVYFYQEVPEYVYVDLLASSSKGRFYNASIKGVYETFGRSED